jgi:hypothetical protein
MEIYLPIAAMSVNVALLLGLGAGIGFLFGLFGAGGGLLITPLLILLGVPAPVAVASSANQVVGASVSGALAYWRQGTVDFKLGGVMLGGGFLGSLLGVYLFGLLQRLGQIELVINLAYFLFLGAIGALMLVESLLKVMRGSAAIKRRKLHEHSFLHGLPFRMRFPKSRLYTSALLPIGIGFLVGLLASIMGVGGGFIMVPAMIYLLGMPSSTVIGTSLFQSAVVTANVTWLHAANTQTVDIYLALILLTGAVVGAQGGARVGSLLRGEHLRALMALIILGVSVRVGWLLTATPDDLYMLEHAVR